MSARPVLGLKRTLLLFWPLWWAVVLATNVFDAGEAVGVLAEGWAFASGNLRYLEQTTARHGTPTWLNAVLFAGVLAWEATAAALFRRAWWGLRGKQEADGPVLFAAFTVALSLWLAFLIADEVCIAYAVAATHLRLFAAQLVTPLAPELVAGDHLPPSSRECEAYNPTTQRSRDS